MLNRMASLVIDMVVSDKSRRMDVTIKLYINVAELKKISFIAASWLGSIGRYGSMNIAHISSIGPILVPDDTPCGGEVP